MFESFVLEIAQRDGCWHLRFLAEDGTSMQIHLPADFTEESMGAIRMLLSDEAENAIIEAVAMLTQEDNDKRLKAVWN